MNKAKPVWRVKNTNEPKSRESFVEVNDLDILVLLELTYDEIISLIINKNIQSIIEDDHFWCLWLQKHNLNVNKNCKFFAKNISQHHFDLKEYHLSALENNDLNSVKLLYTNKLCSPSDLLCIHYYVGGGCIEEHPLIISVTNEFYALTKYLLTFKPDVKILTKALDTAVKYNINANILSLLLHDGAGVTQTLLTYGIEHNNVDFIRLFFNLANIEKPLFKSLLGAALEKKYEEILVILLSSSSNTMPYEFKNYFKNLKNKDIAHMKPLILRYLSL
jgi:hypothetical protein